VGAVRREILIAIPVLAFSLVSPSSAVGHGPCRVSVERVGCLKPSSGQPGTRITILGTRVYWVIWNANIRYDSESHYQRGAPTVELVKLRRVQRNVAFVAPDVSPGIYPVAIYDGAEAGEHFTWDLFRVSGPSSFWRTGQPWLFAIALGTLIAIFWFARVRIRRSRWPNAKT
jgi:hypothetical protein